MVLTIKPSARAPLDWFVLEGKMVMTWRTRAENVNNIFEWLPRDG